MSVALPIFLTAFLFAAILGLALHIAGDVRRCENPDRRECAPAGVKPSSGENDDG